MLKCTTCGRPFPEGQGIIVRKGGLTLAFHSSRCTYKFFKLLFERIEEDCVVDAARDLTLELAKSLESKVVKKKI